MRDDENKPPTETRTGADLIAALQSSPHREIEIEPERYFGAEEEFSALLLAMVIKHSQGYSWEDHRAGLKSYLNAPHTTDDDLDSYDIPENADAMVALETEGYIEIVHQEGARIWAKVTSAGRALLERLALEQKRNAAASSPSKKSARPRGQHGKQ